MSYCDQIGRDFRPRQNGKGFIFNACDRVNYNNSSVILKQVDDFFKYAKTVSEKYRSQNILITMGDDFNYQSAQKWYRNLDKLIQ